MTIRNYCEKYQKQIFVRAKKDGKWGSFSLDQISKDQRDDMISRWEWDYFYPYLTAQEETKCQP